MSPPRRILVRAPNWIGDQVMAREFYHCLKQLYPEAELGVLAVEGVADLIPDGFERHSYLRPRFRSVGGMLGIAGELRGAGYELAFTLATSVSSSVLLWLAGIPRRVGYAEPLGRVFLTDSLPWEGRRSRTHKSQLYLQLLEWASATSLPVWETPLRAAPSPSAPIILAPGASLPLREWPGFETLLRELRQTYPDRKLIVVGSTAERGWHSRLEKIKDPLIEDRIETTSVPQLVSLLGGAWFVVANDSGVAHLAATLARVPTFVLFGPGDPQYIAPEGPVTPLRLSDLPCSPCESAHCRAPYGYQKCLRDLSVDNVLTEITKQF